MALQPRKIVLRACRVYDREKFLFANLVNDEVINDASPLIQQEGVLTRSNIELADVICEHGIEPFARAGSLHDQLPHVVNIEDSHIVSDGLMFLDDVRVLHRHEPPGERNHSRAEPNVLVAKGCLFLLALGHERQPRLTKSYRKRINSASTPHLHPLLDRGGEEKLAQIENSLSVRSDACSHGPAGCPAAWP